ncbi:hypothetical protein [Actinoplanes utahensis]|uniref:Uncharacterized protein n=1 Tax=Actinoplanes utahensis TaxID=1869 RepID=A0A0A6UU80_ACTUT|nr:hypothetical protein [Actinoplanes utahensis]KHD78019.1 hypothetical protein MB27_07910 [Actinoplanes utahensis]GIF30021.1 hypothetical protein Aut01nite_30070 [Actinoplanes utahensis]
MAAGISIAAWTGRSLAGGVGGGLVLTAVLVPLLLVVILAVAHRLLPAGGGSAAVWEFTVRAAHGAGLRVSIRTGAPRDSLRRGDLVRVVPARRARLRRRAPDRHGPLRAVEILTALGGPVVRRVDADPSLPPVQIAGLALAVLLLASAAAAVLPS